MSELDIPASESTEWAAFERLHGPILVHDRLEVMLALLCSLIANAFSDQRHYKPSDFMPRWDATDEGQSVDEMIAAFERALAKGGH